jgi:2'-5' RNA ligase
VNTSRAEERARLFVALELPAAARTTLERWRAEAVPRVPELRLVAPEALHVTLCFLGWRELSEIDRLSAACEAAVHGDGPPELSLGEPLWLPARRPRVLAVRIEDQSGGLVRVQASVAAALTAGGWYARETRPFLGHVTIARLGRGARVRGIGVSPPIATPFLATAVTLFRSRLGRGGARYEALRTTQLGQGSAVDEAST